MAEQLLFGMWPRGRENREVWRVLNICSFLATTSCVAYPAYVGGVGVGVGPGNAMRLRAGAYSVILL